MDTKIIDMEQDKNQDDVNSSVCADNEDNSAHSTVGWVKKQIATMERIAEAYEVTIDDVASDLFQDIFYRFGEDALSYQNVIRDEFGRPPSEYDTSDLENWEFETKRIIEEMLNEELEHALDFPIDYDEEEYDYYGDNEEDEDDDELDEDDLSDDSDHHTGPPDSPYVQLADRLFRENAHDEGEYTENYFNRR